jgi:hypothetical protein
MWTDVAGHILAAIVVGVLTFVATMIYQTRFFARLTGRSREVSGEWQGVLEQVVNGVLTKRHLELTLKLGLWKSVKGSAELSGPTGGHGSKGADPNTADRFQLAGGFLYERFLSLDYKCTDKQRIQFGSTFFQLSATGETLKGKYLGFGPADENIVVGNIELAKKKA